MFLNGFHHYLCQHLPDVIQTMIGAHVISVSVLYQGQN